MVEIMRASAIGPRTEPKTKYECVSSHKQSVLVVPGQIDDQDAQEFSPLAPEKLINDKRTLTTKFKQKQIRK